MRNELAVIKIYAYVFNKFLLFLFVHQVWFQNRRSKERRMKQLSALGARRHAFFRSPRRMRTLVDRLEPGELIPNGPFSYYGGKIRWFIFHIIFVWNRFSKRCLPETTLMIASQ